MTRSHRPRSCPHQMGSLVEVELARAADRASGVGSAADRLRAGQGRPRTWGGAVSESAVYRALTRLNLIDPQPVADAVTASGSGGSAVTPMELWQMDVVGGFVLADGTRAKVLTGVDDHSRFCVSAHLMVRETIEERL